MCQWNKTEGVHPASLLQPLSVSDQIWEDLGMDFNEGLPKSGGYNSIMVVVDSLSKYAHVILLSHPFSTKQVEEVFIQEFIKHHGISKSIVSNRDNIFLSHFWKELFSMWGTKLNHSIAFHPQTDGHTKRVNHCLEIYLPCFCNEQPLKWSK